MKLFKQNDELFSTALQITALSCMAVGMLIGQLVFDQLITGLLVGFFVFVLLLVVHSRGRLQL